MRSLLLKKVLQSADSIGSRAATGLRWRATVKAAASDRCPALRGPAPLPAAPGRGGVRAPQALVQALASVVAAHVRVEPEGRGPLRRSAAASREATVYTSSAESRRRLIEAVNRAGCYGATLTGDGGRAFGR